MTKIVNIHEAKTHLSRLLEQVKNGDEIVIAKAGHPVARLTAFDGKAAPRLLGTLRGKIKVADDFDDELSPSVLKLFNGEK
jgi:prevent-host-death family protein